ncbi:MAG: hypothetical protein O2865_13330 [Planctomycetota bacterium]|nr:hypothetical protein [Planctomycetota bacterium]
MRTLLALFALCAAGSAPAQENPSGAVSNGKQAENAALDDEGWPPYRKTDYGDALHWTYQVGPDLNIVQKGVAVRVDGGEGGLSRGRAFVVYDLDTLSLAAAWSGEGFIDWKGVAFDGSHNSHASIVGEVAVTNPVGPGWAKPGSEDFTDERFVGRDGRRFGPIAREWGQFRGRRDVGGRTLLEYDVGGTHVRELPGAFAVADGFVFSRAMEVGASEEPLRVRIGRSSPGQGYSILTSGTDRQIGKTQIGGHDVLVIEPGTRPARVLVLFGAPAEAQAAAIEGNALRLPLEFEAMDAGPATHWPATARSEVQPGEEQGIWTIDEFTLPDLESNPYRSWLRLGAFDFFADGERAAVSTWNGDVWIVSGVDQRQGTLTWRRFATGLFQPLGVRVIDDVIHVGCRDQICVLEDTNGDGEADHYRCLNNDHQVTEHFHEFAMGLQTDADGNFYYAKSARHAKTALVPHHGTLLKVSKDGSTTEILANGFRAANGVCVNGDGTFYVTDQEGHWTPKNRINRVVPGGFYGNMMGYHDRESSADEDMEQPLCWITNAFDRSPAELVRVEGDRWGLPDGALLQLSYGMGRAYLVLEDEVDGAHQGGMVALPFGPFATGVMRGRFHPGDGQLYCCGLYGWSSARTRPGGFYRVRYRDRPLDLPVRMRAQPDGIELGFGAPLDPETARDPESYSVQVWSLHRSKGYGSKHIDERPLGITSASLSDDGRTVRLVVEDLEPTMCIEVRVDVDTGTGELLSGVIHGTIHRMPEAQRK